MTLGDIWAQVAACKMLEERLQPLLRDTDLEALGAEIRRRSESGDAQGDPRGAGRRVSRRGSSTTASRSRSSSTAP